MNRRDLIAGLLFVTATKRADAQQPGKVYRIAIVVTSMPAAEMGENSSDPILARDYRTFFAELRQQGYFEGQNLKAEMYSDEGHTDRLQALADEVVRRNPDVIYALGAVVLRACKQATATIPIVGLTGDPVEFGVVRGLSRPGGNITGSSVDAGIEILGKRLELLKEALPKLARLGFLLTSSEWGNREMAVLRQWSESRHISLVGSQLGKAVDETAYRSAFATMSQEMADAVYVGYEGEHYVNQRLIVELAATSRLPAFYAFRESVEVGGLMAYASDISDTIRHNADLIAKILGGAKPGDIPFYQSRKFDLVINLRTAKALDLTIPLSLLVQAEVIE
jgi:putative ABC transport system substrate-binding protein